MKTKRRLLVIIPIVIITMAVIKLKSNKKASQDKVYRYDKEQAINVQAETITLQSTGNTSAYPGTFEPNKETKLSAEIQGKINSIMVDAGSHVKKGQTLIQLDNSLLQLQLQAIEVQIEGLEADVKRYTVLANADAIQGVQLEKAELGLKSAKVQKATLQEQVNKTSIKAPFDGIVTAKLSEEGAFAAPGAPLLQITDIAGLKFTVNVPENALEQFKPEQTYSVTADIYPGIGLTGKAIMIGSKANTGNSFPVQFLVSNTPDLKIKSGMFGKVTLNEKQETGYIIPSSAVQSTSGQTRVYLVRSGKAKLQNISVSKRLRDKVVVTGGLKEGDMIVTNGFINLFDGANVSVK